METTNIDGLTAEAKVQRIQELESQLAKAEGKRLYVGVRHLTDNEIAYIRPFGAPSDGSRDIVFKGYGDLQLVPWDKWAHMVKSRHSDIVDGFFVRDDDAVTGEPSITKESFGENEFPNAILDIEIRELLLDERNHVLEKRINTIDNFYVLGRFLRIANDLTGNNGKLASKMVQCKDIVRKRAKDMAHKKFFPDNFKTTDCGGLLKIASNFNIQLPRGMNIDLDDTPEELALYEVRLRRHLERQLTTMEKESFGNIANWEGEDE